ncbi:MAG: DUF1559 domain-containing protein [Planctomycetota bacterium]
MRRGKSTAFTLVELLVVIAIIGILVALLLPAVQAAREAARRSQCVNNLKQVGLAFHNYHDVHKVFPCFVYRNGQNSFWRGYSAFSQVLPFIEQQPLYDQMETDSVNFWHNWDGGEVAAVRSSEIPSFICPSDESFPTAGGWSNGPGSNYGVSFGSTFVWDNYQEQNGMFRARNDGNARNIETKLGDVRDGTSNTLLASEHLTGDNNDGRLMAGNSSEPRIGSPFPEDMQYPDQGPLNAWGAECESQTNHNSENANQWIAPEPTQTALNTVAPPNWQYPNCQFSGSGFSADRNGAYPPRSRHSGGVNCTLGDASVRFVTDSIDFKTWQFFGSRNDANAISLP